MGSGRHRRNGTVGGGETNGFVDVGRFLVVRNDRAGVFSDRFHGFLESSGFLDSEDIDKDWVGR